jgi:lipopolysaccharide transport system ATP-binding protein
MSDTVIRVENLWKQYRLGTINHGTLRADLASWWARMRGREDPNLRIGSVRQSEDTAGSADRFWALKDINLEVKQGEVLGIIGKNGAGKSTLLKILSRVTTPTRGQIKVKGRIASLLEVGTGFHPELTGRENIFLNGAILGMNKEEIRSKLDEIIAFAEIEKFIDTPVKRYSSGMYVRLAFAVAAHLEPEILVVDEVLAVGDAEFQNKCLGKMDDVRGEGRTVLIVSHNIPLITQLCRRAIWLDNGCVKEQGDFREVSLDYLSFRQTASAEWIPEKVEEDFYYERVAIHAPAGNSPDSIPASQAFQVEFVFVVKQDGLRGRLALQVRDRQGTPIFSSANTDGLTVSTTIWNAGKHIVRCEVPGHLLSPGVYLLTISQPSSAGDVVIEDVCSFRVDAVDSLVSKDRRAGVIAPLLKWQVVT